MASALVAIESPTTSFNSLDYFYKKEFHSKIFKVSLNAGFTCPNKDGTKGIGGCIYCSKSGSGDFAGNPEGICICLKISDV